MTVVWREALPLPLQLKVNVVVAVRAPELFEPLVTTAPPGLIVQLLALALAHDSVLEALYAIEAGEALKLLMVGAGTGVLPPPVPPVDPPPLDPPDELLPVDPPDAPPPAGGEDDVPPFGDVAALLLGAAVDACGAAAAVAPVN